MNNKINLRHYQEELLAKIQAKEASGFNITNSYLGVMVREDFVLVSLTDISEVVSMSECSKVPLTKSWFLGLANVRGRLYAVNDLSLLVVNDQEETAIESIKSNEARLLLLNESLLDKAALLVDRVIGLRQLTSFTAVAKIGNSHKFYTKQYEDNQGNIWYMLDMQMLVDSNIFLQPSLV